MLYSSKICKIIKIPSASIKLLTTRILNMISFSSYYISSYFNVCILSIFKTCHVQLIHTGRETFDDQRNRRLIFILWIENTKTKFTSYESLSLCSLNSLRHEIWFSHASVHRHFRHRSDIASQLIRQVPRAGWSARCRYSLPKMEPFPTLPKPKWSCHAAVIAPRHAEDAKSILECFRIFWRFHQG